MATETFVIEIRTRGTKKAAGDIKRIGRSASSTRKTLALMRNALVAVAAVRVFAKMTANLVEFSDQMLVVKAVTASTTAEFERLRDVAKGLGATTRFTAAEAAEGMAFLARAGFEVNEVISAIPATLDLAAAASLDLGNAADIASNLMTSFGLTVKDLPDIIDTLVFTANNANTTVQQLADGLKLFAPLASQFGVSIEEAASAMGVLGDAGIQASLAGTGLRRFFTDLEAPVGNTAKILKLAGVAFDDVRPSMNSVADILDTLTEANIGASAASLLFGKRGGFVFASLQRQREAFKELTLEQEKNTGVAKENARILESGLGGALRLVRSALQNLLITFGDLGGEEFLNQFFRALAEGLRAVARNADSVVVAIKVLIGVMVARKVLLFGKAMLVTAFNIAVAGKNALKSAAQFGIMRTSIKGVGKALLRIPFIAILTGIGLLVVAAIAFRDQMKLMGDDGGNLNDVFTTTGNLLKEELVNAVNAAGFEFGDFSDIVDTVSMRVASAIEGIIAVMFGLIKASKAIFIRVTAEFKKFLLGLEAVQFSLQSGVNKLFNAVGFDDFFDLSDNAKEARELAEEIAALNKEIAAGGTVWENYLGGGRSFLDARKEVTKLRLVADRDAAILATEKANREAAQKRLPGKEAPEAFLGDQFDLGGSGDADKAIKEIERLTDALRDLEAQHFPLLAAQDAETEVLATINDALNKGVELRVSYSELLTRTIREQVGATKTTKQAAEEQEVLNDAWKRGAINLEELQFLQRKSAIGFLDSQRDATSGAARAFLKLTQDATDAAAFTEMVFTDAFKSIEDAVVDFATTGSFSVNEFFRNFAEQLLRLGTQQAIAGIGSAFTGAIPGGAVGATGGFNVGNFVASLFHDGGSFTVGSQASVAAQLPGLDNRLVAFGAQAGETVTVTPRNAPEGSGGLGAGATNVVFNVVTPDADSFNRSQSQLQNRLVAGIGQARRKR